jgi:hypothetical protein
LSFHGFGHHQKPSLIAGGTGGGDEIAGALAPFGEIEQDYIDGRDLDVLQRLAEGPAFLDYLKTSFRSQQPGQAGTKEDLIAEDDQPKLFCIPWLFHVQFPSMLESLHPGIKTLL